MALFLRRGAALASRSIRAAAAASTAVHRLPSDGSLAGAGALAPTKLFLLESRRGFAKGKKSKDNGRGDTVQDTPDIGPTVKSAATQQMEASVVALSRELSKLRTGRASPGMLDHIIVETADVKVPLNRVAVVSVLDAHTLSVMPYDPSSMKSIEHAIISSPLGINPTPDGNRIIANIPPHYARSSLNLLRISNKALDTIKKSSSGMPKDDVKRLEKEIEELTKKFIKSADDMCKAKEKEISGN
uniref:Ribosome-recycling factor, chloroplastic n=1 Tax=Leersia perrieri TaxID=77586 RepID=A0A0D9W6J5_9ORYZ